jgi:hypothetical protein
MKRSIVAALIAGQVLAAAQPAMAADFTSAQEQRAGAFAGLRLRMPLDGARHRQIRAGFALAPTLGTRGINGDSRLRIGEGLELGITGRQPVRLLFAGQDVRRLGAAQGAEGQEGERRGGPSTLGWIAIGVGAAVVIVVGAAALCISDSDCVPSE